MPKSSKKRKEKAADFSKAKLKLGKGKKLPTNAVDTSFKARSIALPTQSITIDKDAAIPTTKRKLAFDDLVSHIKHYNANTRREAILGLRELLESYSDLILELLTPIINSCIRLLSDEDASVRKTLLSFFQWLIPQLPTENLTPHSPVILLFTTSAQTHIFPEIRLDAIRFLDLFLEFIPHIVVEGWSEPGNTHGKRVLNGYLGLLNAGTKFGEGGDTGPTEATSTASVVLSATSKLTVFKSLSTFLHQAVSRQSHSSCHIPSSSIPTWYMASSFVSPVAYCEFDSILQTPITIGSSDPTQKMWKPDCELEDDSIFGQYSFAMAHVEAGFSLQDLSDVTHTTSITSGVNISNATDRSDITYISHLTHTLHPLLVSTFLDCAPSVFSPGSNPPETGLQLVTTLVEICRTLYNVILQGQASDESKKACDELRAIIGYMSPYFPFHPGLTKRDVKVEQTVQDLNIAFCELTSLLILAGSEPVSTTKKGKRRVINKGKGVQNSSMLSLPIDRVSEYISQLLQGESSASNGLSRTISLSAYTALLPTIWSLLNMSGYHQLGEVAENIVDHAIRTSSTSAVKKAAIEFIGRLMLLRTESQYVGSFKTDCNREVEAKFEEWIIQLPKTLWELGTNHIASSEAILRVLLRIFQRKACGIETVEAVCSRLVPYFEFSHPTRGKQQGPFCKLPGSCRKLVLDMVVTIPSFADAEMGGLRDILDTTCTVEEDRSYWSQIRPKK